MVPPMRFILYAKKKTWAIRLFVEKMLLHKLLLLDNGYMSKKNVISKRATTLIIGSLLFLTGCGTPSEPTLFHQVSYYDDASTPTLVGLSYVRDGKAANYSPLVHADKTTTIYDFISKQTDYPAVGAHYSFSSWDYGYYPESSSQSTSDSISSSTNTPVKVDPLSIKGDCSVHPVFGAEYYSFSVGFKNGAESIRDEAGNATKNFDFSSLDTLVAPKANGGTAYLIPEKAGLAEGHKAAFLGYGVSLDTRILPGVVTSSDGFFEHISISSGLQDPDYNDESLKKAKNGSIYVKTAAGEGGVYDFPFYIKLDNNDAVQDDWILLGSLNSKAVNAFSSITFKAIFDSPTRENISLKFNDADGKLLSSYNIPYGDKLILDDVSEVSPTSLKVSPKIISIEDGTTITPLQDFTLTVPAAAEGKHHVLNFAATYDKNQGTADINSLRGNCSIRVTASEVLKQMNVTLNNDGAEQQIKKVDYGKTLASLDDPTYAGSGNAADFAFYGWCKKEGTTLVPFDFSSLIKNDLELFAVYVKKSQVYSDTASSFTFTYDANKKYYSWTGFSTTASSVDLTNMPAFEWPSNPTGLVVPVVEISSPFGDSTVKNAITKISIPNSIKVINSKFFSNLPNLTQVGLGTSISTIPDEAFNGSPKLANLVVPTDSALTSIGAMAFKNTALTSLDLRNAKGLAKILQKAFSGCASLNEIILPDSVTSIGQRAFEFDETLKVFLMATVLPNGGYGTNWNLCKDDATSPLFVKEYLYSENAPTSSGRYWHADPQTGAASIW